MLSQNIEQMLNDQINKEMYSAYLYMSMSAYLESLNLTGYANWFMIQAQEERDHKTVRMLDWFVSEQVEEEENAQNNLEKYRLFGHEAKGLYMLDKEMAARVYVPSAPLTQEA